MRKSGRVPALLMALAVPLLLAGGALAAQPAGETPEASTLRATINQGRVSAGQNVLAADAVLDEAAQLAAQEGSDSAAVRAFLLDRHYVAMTIDVLSGTGGASALAVGLSWQTDPATRLVLENPGVEEIATAVAANPHATGPNDAYRWVAVLAKPARFKRSDAAAEAR
jgi:hypothetical protein